MAQVSRFIVGSTVYEYKTDSITIEWEEDRQNYRRLDNFVVTEIRSKKAIVRFEGVFDAENTNAQGVGAAELFELIEDATRAGSSVDFVPDISLTSGFNTNPPRVVVVTSSGGIPTSYKKEKGADRLRRTMVLESNKWLDPTVTSDRDTIDDIHDLQGTL
jgi:hypothetical protein